MPRCHLLPLWWKQFKLYRPSPFLGCELSSDFGVFCRCTNLSHKAGSQAIQGHKARVGKEEPPELLPRLSPSSLRKYGGGRRAARVQVRLLVPREGGGVGELEQLYAII